MEAQLLQTEVRSQTGKGAARQLRMSGMLPAILYGKGKDPTKVSISSRELSKVLGTELGRNVLLRLHLGEQEELAMVKDLQIHPVSRRPLHVDLYRVDLETPVMVRVPIVPCGRAKGIDAGGEMNVVFRDVPVRALPDKIPVSIEIDVSQMELNDIFQVQQLDLPEEISILLPADRTLVAIVAESKKEEAETVAVEGEESEVSAEGKPEGDSQSGDDSKKES